MTKNPSYLLFAAMLSSLLIPFSTQAEEPGLLDKASRAADKAWDSTKEHAGNAANWTADKAEQGWDKTQQGAGEVWDATREKSGEAATWTSEKAKQGADTTQEGAVKVWDKTKQATGDALKWTGEKANEAADALQGDAPNGVEQAPAPATGTEI